MPTRIRAVQPTREAFLDTLRAVGALAVLLAHVLSELFPEFQRFRFSMFDLGSFGVMIFFLCSGFIIQPSIEHAPSLQAFWRRRIYRLYPIYWFSVLVTAAMTHLEIARVSALITRPKLDTVLINLTMVQTFLGAAHLQVVYWSLTFELIFYIVISLFVLAGLNRYSVIITAGMVGITLIAEVLVPLLGGPRIALMMCGFLTIMFSGALLNRMAEGKVGKRTALGLIMLGLLVNIAAALVNSWLNSGSWWQNLYLMSAWVAAYAIFIAAYALRASPLLALAPLQFIGRISYSIYLLHLPAILIIPPLGSSVASAIAWLSASIGLATVTYFAIERPMIRRAAGLRQSPLGALHPRRETVGSYAQSRPPAADSDHAGGLRKP